MIIHLIIGLTIIIISTITIITNIIVIVNIFNSKRYKAKIIEISNKHNSIFPIAKYEVIINHKLNTFEQIIYINPFRFNNSKYLGNYKIVYYNNKNNSIYKPYIENIFYIFIGLFILILGLIIFMSYFI